jgi:hypothetical protein
MPAKHATERVAARRAAEAWLAADASEKEARRAKAEARDALVAALGDEVGEVRVAADAAVVVSVRPRRTFDGDAAAEVLGDLLWVVAVPTVKAPLWDAAAASGLLPPEADALVTETEVLDVRGAR